MTGTKRAGFASRRSRCRWPPRSVGTPRLPRPAPGPGGTGSNHPVELWNLLGGGIPFGGADILARYGDRDRYQQQVQDCVADLVDRRHLLGEDADRVVAHALTLWDRALA